MAGPAPSQTYITHYTPLITICNHCSQRSRQVMRRWPGSVYLHCQCLTLSATIKYSEILSPVDIHQHNCVIFICWWLSLNSYYTISLECLRESDQGETETTNNRETNNYLCLYDSLRLCWVPELDAGYLRAWPRCLQVLSMVHTPLPPWHLVPMFEC